MIFINYTLALFSRSDDSAKHVKIQTQTSILATVGGTLATIATFLGGVSKLCCPGAEMGSATHYMRRRNSASIMKVLIFFKVCFSIDITNCSRAQNRKNQHNVW